MHSARLTGPKTPFYIQSFLVLDPRGHPLCVFYFQLFVLIFGHFRNKNVYHPLLCMLQHCSSMHDNTESNHSYRIPSPCCTMRFPHVALAIMPNANEMYMQRK